MKNRSLTWTLVVLFISMSFGAAEMLATTKAFYIRVIDPTFTPDFTVSPTGELLYTGTDSNLASLYSGYTISEFRTAFANYDNPLLKRTYFVRVDDDNLMKDLLQRASYVFEHGHLLGDYDIELTSDETTLLSYTNDYGPTGPPGSDMGAGAILDHLDFLNVPTAWDYGYGSLNVKIGISDSHILFGDADFAGKTTIIHAGCTSSLCATHGTSTAANAAAQGDNAHGVVGVCSDCSILGVAHGNYEFLKDLALAGAKIINCSWAVPLSAPNPEQQMAIDEIYEMGTIVVASSGNESWATSPGTKFRYPASYDNVISVANVGHRYAEAADNLGTHIIGGVERVVARNIKDYIGYMLTFTGDDPTTEPHVYKWGTYTLNTAVDIQSTGMEIFSYGAYLNGVPADDLYRSGTSASAPMVSGTLGLMLSLYSCLSFEDAESILKFSSRNVDYRLGNLVYKGYYGSGSLNTGRALEMVYNMITPGQTVYIENQSFDRWDFEMDNAPEKVVMRNQIFEKAAILKVLAQQDVNIIGGTTIEGTDYVLFEPKDDAFVLIEIDPDLVPGTCSTGSFIPEDSTKIEKQEKFEMFKLYPTLINDITTIQKIIPSGDLISKVVIYNSYGQKVYEQNFDQGYIHQFNLAQLHTGIYIAKFYGDSGQELYTTKFIKN